MFKNLTQNFKYLIYATGLLNIADNFNLIAFLIIGISGNFFNKLFYEHYELDNLASLFTFVSTLFACFGIGFMILPIFYDNIYALGIIFNVMTIVFIFYYFLIDRRLTISLVSS